MKHKQISISILLACSCLGAPAQQLTVEQLVAEALQKNPELEFYRAELSAATAQTREAGRLQNPELSADVGRKRTRSADLASEGVAWSVSLQQSFEFPGRLGLRKAIANRQVELAELGLDQFKAALAAEVRELAFELRNLQQRAEAARQIEQRSRELIGVLVQRDPAGLTPLLETRIIEASVLRLQAESLKAVADAQSTLMELNRLRGAPLGTDLQIANASLRLPELPPLEELLSIAATNNFLLRIRQAELAQQGFKVDLARNERWPAISAGPFFSHERAGEKEEIVGVGVSIPLPLWTRNEAAVETAEARLQQAQTALRRAQQEIERDLRHHYLTYRTYAGQIRNWRTNILEELQDAAELGDRHYRLGAIPVSTYVELQEKFAEGLQAIFETQAAALRSLQEIEETSGVPLGERTVLKSGLPVEGAEVQGGQR